MTMQAPAATSVDATPPEDFDDSVWSSLWLSGWDCWADAYLTEEKCEAAPVPAARRTRPNRSGPRGAARGHDACSGQPPPPARAQTLSNADAASTSSKADDEHICTICGKGLSSHNALRLHSKTHEGGRPWKCEECGACFARKDHLRVHYRVHTGERPYSCKICGNSFAHSGTLKSHIRTHTGEKPFACDACGVCFSDPSTLRMHRLKHAGVKSFVCGDCGRAFASNGILNKHKRVHPDGGCAQKRGRVPVSRCVPMNQYVEEQLLPCDVCGRLFKSEQSLTLHMKNHSEAESRSRGSADEEEQADPLRDTDTATSPKPLENPLKMDVEAEKMDEGFDGLEKSVPHGAESHDHETEKKSDASSTGPCSNSAE